MYLGKHHLFICIYLCSICQALKSIFHVTQIYLTKPKPADLLDVWIGGLI